MSPFAVKQRIKNFSFTDAILSYTYDKIKIHNNFPTARGAAWSVGTVRSSRNFLPGRGMQNKLTLHERRIACRGFQTSSG